MFFLHFFRQKVFTLPGDKLTIDASICTGYISPIILNKSPEHVRILLSATLFNTIQWKICCWKVVYKEFSHYLSFYYIFPKYECHQMIYLTTENAVVLYSIRDTT